VSGGKKERSSLGCGGGETVGGGELEKTGREEGGSFANALGCSPWFVGDGKRGKKGKNLPNLIEVDRIAGDRQGWEKERLKKARDLMSKFYIDCYTEKQA